jgi:LPXTG-motif cell wall-anchored protein
MTSAKSILISICLLVAQLANAQGGHTIKASVDKSRILIGEPIQLTIQAYFSPESVKNFIKIDSIEHFEFLEKPVIDTLNKVGGLTLRSIYKITSFDSGHWIIPAFSLSKKIKTNPISIDVVFSDADPNQPYHGIKDIMEVPPKENKDWQLIAIGAALIAMLLLLFLFRKKKPKTLAEVKEIINPYEEAMKQLEQLQKEKVETKQFHTQLTDIFRLYIFRKKGIHSLQKTTDDLALQLRKLDIDPASLDNLSQSLRMSDYVKFAKYIPAPEDDKKCFTAIKNAIINIENAENKLPVGDKS